MELTRYLLLDSIHGVAGTALYHPSCIVSRGLRVSHTAFPLRWAGGNIECRILQAHNSSKFVNLLLLLVKSGKQLVELVILLLLLSQLCSRSASVSLLVFGKPKPPRERRAKASCLSSVFVIPEDQCQQEIGRASCRERVFRAV